MHIKRLLIDPVRICWLRSFNRDENKNDLNKIEGWLFSHLKSELCGAVQGVGSAAAVTHRVMKASRFLSSLCSTAPCDVILIAAALLSPNPLSSFPALIRGLEGKQLPWRAGPWERSTALLQHPICWSVVTWPRPLQGKLGNIVQLGSSIPTRRKGGQVLDHVQ